MPIEKTSRESGSRNHGDFAGRAHGWTLAGSVALAALLLPCANAPAVLLQPGFDQVFIDDVGGPTRAWGVGVADFNGDGIDDIVSGDTQGDVHLYTGNGDGSFADQGVRINMSFNDAYGLAAADFNGDGQTDFVLGRTGGSATPTTDGNVLLYLGNGNGTFQSTGFPQLGLLVGDAGTDVVSLAAADVDGDDDVDLVAGDVTASENNRADVILFRNGGNDALGHPLWTSETVVSAASLATPDPEQPPYFPPTAFLQGWGLAFGDVDGDLDPDLLVGDRASYLYVYANDGTGLFAPIRYDRIGTRPFAFARIHETFATQLPIATGDLNADGLVDFVTGGTDAIWEGKVDLWLNTGNDGSGRPDFLGAGIIGGAGTDARGLATGQLDPSVDGALDVVFGNFEGQLHALFADLTDADGDGIIDRFDNAPSIANAPRIDMNTDGGINRLDQLDNDHDGVGDPADTDDDDDGVPDGSDNCMFSPNPDQANADDDGRGDACDPLNDADADGDGVPDGPLDPELRARAQQAKARWSRSDTRFIVRMDALGRVFQNEFVQTFVDAAILSPAEWDAKKFENYNGIGDDPAVAGYGVPADLPGGKEVPITALVIPKQLWNAFGDPDPIRWIDDRNGDPDLEIALHGTYHANNTPLGDWAGLPDRNFFSCEFCGLTLEENFQLLRVGLRTLLGDYGSDPWIQQSGADPATSPRIDWSDAANPLFTYAPPFNTSDTPSRDAVAQLGLGAFSASIFEEQSPIFTPEGSHHEAFDPFGLFHASADLQVDPEAPQGMDYLAYLQAITEPGGLNTWLIEEVEWSTRYCNDQERLTPCAAAPEGVNRENNMVDPDRWEKWMTLLDYVKTAGVPMTMGDYALAVAFDNAPTVSNPDQRDSDHDGIGDAVDDAMLDAADVTVECGPSGGIAALNARLFTPAGPLAGQTVAFSLDADGDGTPESAAGATGADGVATAAVPFDRPLGTVVPYTAQWDGGLISAQDTANVTVVDTTPPVVGAVSASPNLLWPPNHKFVRVRVTASVSDVCDPAPTCRITEVTSNEPVDGTDDGDTAPDWMITDDLTARLRAERAGTGTGRIYSISVACTDGSGNTATAVTTVQVPLDLP